MTTRPRSVVIDELGLSRLEHSRPAFAAATSLDLGRGSRHGTYAAAKRCPVELVDQEKPPTWIIIIWE